MKKLLPYLATALTLQAFMPPHALAGGAPFQDVSGHWAESDIRAAIASGWVNGFPDGSFQPDRTVTRGEFLKLLVKAKGITADAATISDPRLAALSQHNSDSPHWVAANGYLKAGMAAHFVEPADYGFSFTQAGDINAWSLKPDQPLTRLEAAIFVTRAMGRQYDAEAYWIASNKGEAKWLPKPAVVFADAAAIPAWGLGWVKAASESGAVKGFPDGAFHGDARLNRAEAVTLLHRLSAMPATAGNVTRTLDAGYPETEYDLGNMANRNLSAIKRMTVAPLKGYSTFQVLEAFHRLPKADQEAAVKERMLAYWAELQQRNLSPAVITSAHLQLMIGDYFLAAGDYNGTTFTYMEGHFETQQPAPADPALDAQVLGSIIADPQDRERQQTEMRRAEVAKHRDMLKNVVMAKGYRFPYQYMGDLLGLPEADLEAWARPLAQAYWAEATAKVENVGGHLAAVSLVLRPSLPADQQYLGLQVGPTLQANPAIELVYNGQSLTVKRAGSVSEWASTLKPVYFRMGGDGAVQDWHEPAEKDARPFMERFVMTLGSGAPAR